MNHRHALLFLICALVLLVLGNAAYRAIYPVETPMVIEGLWTDAQAVDVPCAINPVPQAYGITVEPSDIRRIA